MGFLWPMHLTECVIKRMMSARVIIQIHLDSFYSQTSSSSMSSVIMMLMAVRKETDLSMEHMAELIGMQS
jgi:hypothetical protein